MMMNRKFNKLNKQNIRVFIDWGHRVVFVKIFQGKEFRILDEKFDKKEHKTFRKFLKFNLKYLDLYLATHEGQMELKSFENLN